MKGYIIKRVVVALVLVFVVLTIVFFAFRLGGADPVAIMLPPDATPRDQQVLTEKFGLNKPLTVQYATFVKNAVRGDFGMSFKYSEPALTVLMDRFPATIKLGLVAFVISLVVGIPIGILSAVRRDSWVDRIGRTFALAGMSLPTF